MTPVPEMQLIKQSNSIEPSSNSCSREFSREMSSPWDALLFFYRPPS